MKANVLKGLSILALLYSNEVYSIKNRDIKHVSTKFQITNNTVQLKQTNQ
jgi:hypothetical protein